MSIRCQVVKVGDSLGLALPDELLARLGAGPGDTLVARDIPDGIELSLATGPKAQLPVAREVMTRRRDALRDLTGKEPLP